MFIQLSEQAFDPWLSVSEYQKQVLTAGQHGACSVFVGTMRDFNQGDGVQAMFLEHYPGMTEKQLQHIVVQAEQQWTLLDCFILHRVGLVHPDETLVVVSVWSVHRGDAFDACRFIMENLKNRAPFWKKELLATGEQRWVTKNSDGYSKPSAF